jgi:hypothetical protein
MKCSCKDGGLENFLAGHFDLMAFTGIEYHREFLGGLFHGIFAEFIQLVFHQYLAVFVFYPHCHTGGGRPVGKTAFAGDGTVSVVIAGEQRGVGLADARKKQPEYKNGQQVLTCVMG